MAGQERKPWIIRIASAIPSAGNCRSEREGLPAGRENPAKIHSRKIFYKIIKKVLTNEIKYVIMMPERREANKKSEVNG